MKKFKIWFENKTKLLKKELEKIRLYLQYGEIHWEKDFGGWSIPQDVAYSYSASVSPSMSCSSSSASPSTTHSTNMSSVYDFNTGCWTFDGREFTIDFNLNESRSV